MIFSSTLDHATFNPANHILHDFRVDVENEGPGSLKLNALEWLWHMTVDDSVAMQPRSTRELVAHATHYRNAWVLNPEEVEHARKVLLRLVGKD